MQLFIQQLANGIALGCGYGLFALGFGLIFATMNIFTIAQGTLATWGALIALWCVLVLDMPIWVATLIAAALVGVLGVVIDTAFFRPIRARTDSFSAVLLMSIGVWIVLLSLATVATKATYWSFPIDSYPSTYLHIKGIILQPMQIITVGVAVVLTIILHVLLVKTRVGAAIRAVGMSPKSASLSGIRSSAVLAGVSFLAAALVALAGVLSAITTNNVSYLLGENLVLQGLAAVVVGGFGDMRGALLGGILIGASQTLSAQYISNSFADAITFGVLIVFLLFRPRGILGGRQLALDTGGVG